MDLGLFKKQSDFIPKKGNWVLILAGLGFTGYGAYKVYQSPSLTKKKKKLLKLMGALMFVAEAVANTAETIGVVSRDFKEFVLSDSDFIPTSFRQITKIARSDEVSDSVVRITRALTLGIVKGYRSEIRRGDIKPGSAFSDRIFDKLFSAAGSGFASVIVGSFAKNLVMAFYSIGGGGLANYKESVLLNFVCDEKCKQLIGDCVKMFVGTAVAAYLDRTMHINPYNEIFSGLTNPKHDMKMKELLGSICNGAIHTLVTTTDQVLANPTTKYCQIEDISEGNKPPRNRKFIVDLTGRVTFETIRSLLEFLLDKLWQSLRNGVLVINEVVFEKGFQMSGELVDEVITICISLYLQILGSVWIMVPTL
ncbi:protein PHLOEM PROTEIN 2-LIKE A10-like [Impatiens glandulifera]|uniref:protein PHLOEM PROTEIN 2-LIKE A10-like n=1 Tax=Impatiens glandulifera TaxID=253017 RepID=UPI001FB155E7|nr:protein PHLOEM PROTEIN 2-LIKE A10-like [Impatiens glandulifera]